MHILHIYKGLLHHKTVNSTSFSSHELLTPVMLSPVVATSVADIEILY